MPSLRILPPLTQCPACGAYDSDAEVRLCVRCSALYDRFREALPPTENAIEALVAFMVEERKATGLPVGDL